MKSNNQRDPMGERKKKTLEARKMRRDQRANQVESKGATK